MFKRGDWVVAHGKDYEVNARVCERFEKFDRDLTYFNGQHRYVVQCEGTGLLLIKNGSELTSDGSRNPA